MVLIGYYSGASKNLAVLQGSIADLQKHNGLAALRISPLQCPGEPHPPPSWRIEETTARPCRAWHTARTRGGGAHAACEEEL